jgi:hypothetical protein
VLIKEGLFSHATIGGGKEYLELQGCCFYDGIVKCTVLRDNAVVIDYKDRQIGYGFQGKLSGKIPLIEQKGIYHFRLWLEDTEGKVLEKVQIMHVTIRDSIADKPSLLETGSSPLELETITYCNDGEDNKAVIILTYKNAVEGLISEEPAKGFHIKLAPRFIDYGQITKVKLENNKIILKTSIAYRGPNDISSAFLSYEYPTESQNIIMDSLGRAVPEMDMVKVSSEGFVSPYMNVWQISKSETLKEDFCNISFPGHLTEKDYKEVQFSGWYCEVPEEMCSSEEEAVIYFAGHLLCEEEENFCLHAGICGEHGLKVWFDNKEVMYIGKSGKDAAKLLIEPGMHEILIAVSTNGRKAAGIYARLEKLTYPGNKGNVVMSHPKFPLFIRQSYVKNFQ